MRAPLTLFGWACRQLARQPGTAALAGLAIFALVSASASVLLLTEAWTATARQLLAAGPSHVVRAVDARGWRPLEAAAAVQVARRVIGVTRARPRIWGLARCGEAAVTVVGVLEPAQLAELSVAGPGRGEALLGPGVAAEAGSGVRLHGAAGERSFTIRGRLGDDCGMAMHDLVLLHGDDARELLGLGEGMASDLAVSVFHDSEQEAVAAELTAAFDGSVRVTTRREAVGAAVAAFARQGALRMLLLVPATLALCLLIVVVLRRGREARRELGLYKALGWSTGELVRLQLFAALAVALPAVLFGFAAAYVLVLWPGQQWTAEWLFAWPGRAPALTLTPGAGLQVGLGVAGAVLVPWLLAALLPALRSAAVDPQELISGGRP